MFLSKALLNIIFLFPRLDIIWHYLPALPHSPFQHPNCFNIACVRGAGEQEIHLYMNCSFKNVTWHPCKLLPWVPLKKKSFFGKCCPKRGWFLASILVARGITWRHVMETCLDELNHPVNKMPPPAPPAPPPPEPSHSTCWSSDVCYWHDHRSMLLPVDADEADYSPNIWWGPKRIQKHGCNHEWWWAMQLGEEKTCTQTNAMAYSLNYISKTLT